MRERGKGPLAAIRLAGALVCACACASVLASPLHEGMRSFEPDRAAAASDSFEALSQPDDPSWASLGDRGPYRVHAGASRDAGAEGAPLTAALIPEPPTWTLLAAGCALAVFVARRRRT